MASMSSKWKRKAYLFFALALIAAYLVLPSLLGITGQRQALLDAGKPLPWYMSLLPEKGVNLGLDLQGGIYLEFEVELERAIENKIDLIGNDLKRTLDDDNLPVSSVNQNVSDHTLVVTLADTSKRAAVLGKIHTDYSEVLVERSQDDASKMIFTLSEVYRKHITEQMSKQALEKVRNRIDRYGVSEPSIQRIGSDKIAIELPGVKDPERAIALIKKAGQLEFKIVNSEKTSEQLTALIAPARATAGLADDDYSLDAAHKLTEALRAQLPADTEIAFEHQFDAVQRKIVSATPYLLNRKVEVSGEFLRDASTQVSENQPYVSLSFDARGTELFGESTTKNVGKNLAIVLDGVINSAPVIQEPILGGQARITLGRGNYQQSLKECEDLVLVLQEGALPAQLKETTKTVVGPTLGADSIRQGVMATLIGCAIIFAFMIIYYKASGLLANISLMFNLLFTLAALCMIQATLTLPGIAGLALTIAVGVDANILILERIKEELRAGKDLKAALHAGYSNAIRAIIDSNVTNVIAAVVLYQFGTGPIKGFAVTLMIGLVISMYTSVSVTRLVYDYLITKKNMNRMSL